MRKFMVLLDDSRECLNAIRYAAMRASRTGGGVVVVSVIRPDEIQHGFGVADVMRAEAMERIQAHFDVYAKWMRDKKNVEPELVVREGDPADQLIAYLSEDSEIGVIVLGMASDKGAQNPVVSRLLRDVGMLSAPITLVPGDLEKDRLEAIS
ncbi:MAG: universal stress protein [Paracoccus sp. (in: a-proteobacteria)]|uniref:universal stress protein n=1 Tax=Paracoccus sp. TaxID=267 RepID=UPI0026DF69EF|nr:universal stress protein [Paracoccus sp. (in: a-proteobacteria)]MDO5611658.1 universal stress protein [Paracoccus sp. (in: a-proteobacteria)]